MKKPGEDRRTRRTRSALIAAFNDLVLRHRQRRIRVADIVAHANVGRSTFYEHYDSAEDIHLQALARPLSILADALAGHGQDAHLARLLEHFWDNRQRARASFGGAQRMPVARLLARQIKERLQPLENAETAALPLVAAQLAEGSLGVIRCWIEGEITCTANTLADSLVTSAQRVLGGRFEPRKPR